MIIIPTFLSPTQTLPGYVDADGRWFLQGDKAMRITSRSYRMQTQHVTDRPWASPYDVELEVITKASAA